VRVDPKDRTWRDADAPSTRGKYKGKGKKGKGKGKGRGGGRPEVGLNTGRKKSRPEAAWESWEDDFDL